MENFMEKLLEEVSKEQEPNKKYASVELLYVGPFNAIYLTPARIDFNENDELIISNYAGCGLIDVYKLERLLTASGPTHIRMKIYREDDDLRPQNISIYSEVCSSFFRMNSDMLVLTNIDIDKPLKNLNAQYIIDTLMGKDNIIKPKYENSNKKFSVAAKSLIKTI